LRDPDVSVIIPCFNEKNNIEKTVKGVIAQDFSGNIEIIVVDDGSTDSTYSIVSDYIKENSIPKNRYITVLKKKNGGKPSAINFGVTEAHGKYCVCSDGDTKLDKSAIRLILEKFSEDEDIGIVAGMVHIDNENKIFTRIQEIEYIFGQLQYRFLQSEDRSVLLAPGCIFGIKTKLAKEYPPSDDTCVEDFDTTVSVKTAGWKTVQEPKAIAYTKAPETLKSWWNQRKRWWYGVFQVWRKHKPWKTMWFLFFYPFGYLIGLVNVFTWLSFPFYLMMSSWMPPLIISFLVYASLVFAITIFRLFILLKDCKSLPLITAIPAFILYDSLCTWISAYLFIRYLLGIGVSFKYGQKWVHAK